MNVREAMLQAADYIEAHPESWDFVTNRQPNRCGTPGCMLGWTGVFLGIEKQDHQSYTSSVADALGVGFAEFLDRARLIAYANGWEYGSHSDESEGAAKTLRAYADRYHPAAEPADGESIDAGL